MITFDENKAIANMGDIARFARAFDRLENGKEVTICFLGGSITQGSLSSSPETCYAYRVYSWLKEKFDKFDSIKVINFFSSKDIIKEKCNPYARRRFFWSYYT